LLRKDIHMYATESQPAIGRRHAPMKEQDRKYIADQLLLTADLLELWTGSDVEPNLYRQGATLLRQPQDLPANATSMDAIAVLENVSADVLLDAHSLLGSGDTELLVRLRERIPASVRALLPLNGLGAKRLRVVWREMGITDLASLGLAVAENRLLKAPGFGP
jgi:DNA polymerase (family 10)